MNKFSTLLACAVIIAGCKSGSDKTEAPGKSEIVIAGDTLMISAGSAVEHKIRLVTVNTDPVEIPCTTTATVRALPECIAEVAVPFEGRIVESFVKAGQVVKEGSPLFSMHSPAFFETIKAFLQARQEKQVAELNLHRQQDLVDHGVGIRKELDDARLNYEIASGQVDNLLATLSIYDVKAEDAGVGKPLVVVSPIRGEVMKNNIQIGQYFRTDSDPLVCIADLKKVWVIARVKENRIGFVQNQQEVSVTLDAYPNRSFSGFVSYIGKLLDEQTRSLEVIIECDNAEQMLKPGMFATVTFTHSMEDGIILPATALIQGEGHTYVFKETGKGRYLKTEVDVATVADGKVLVLRGLVPGDVVIGEGTIYLH